MGWLFKGLSLCVLVCVGSAVQAKTSVWKVSDGDHHLYIGGTMHLLAEQDYPLPDAYDHVYRQADNLVFETDMSALQSPAFQASMQRQLTYPAGRSIEQSLSPETLNLLRAFFAQRNVPFDAVKHYKPGLMALSMSMVEFQRLGLTQEGVDNHFHQRAQHDGKDIDWLESPQQQLAFIASMANDDDDALIRYTLDDIKQLPSTLKTMKSTWRSGDMPGLAAISIDPMRDAFPAIYATLIVDRNRDWMPQILAMLEDPDIEFVLVGAMHLAGPDSILTQLQASGYTVEAVSVQ
ncbi:TraB/GumN family protein [Aestuariibacter halophilus]|uniref:TraB/GumN family protein n=1 Tax=Fluctibacter halophilus TaxID=226011 RepID=A0ABS8G4S3_9ALTE|nr:TraB/GumN family protein [Aestuariibacter halophilus]MCC2615535.1 TraB/GumN family protein [Aestuariibacter halophilus]